VSISVPPPLSKARKSTGEGRALCRILAGNEINCGAEPDRRHKLATAWNPRFGGESGFLVAADGAPQRRPRSASDCLALGHRPSQEH